MKKYYFLNDNFKNRMIVGTITLAILSIFNLWFVYKDQSPVKSAINPNDKLSVVEIKRLTHPDYAANNTFYGTLNPFNSDETRILMYEIQQASQSVGGGRGFVWGYIGENECAQNTPCLLNWDNKSEYEEAAQVIPAIDGLSDHRWKVGSLFWSPLANERDILYGIAAKGLYNVYRINVSDQTVTPVISFDPQNGTDPSDAKCYGFTARNTLWCSFMEGDWSSGGFEVDIVSNDINFISSNDPLAVNDVALTYCQAHPGNTLPAQYHGYPHTGGGHGAKSRSDLYRAVDYGTGQGVWRLSDCTYLDDQNYEINSPHDLFWLVPNHVTWNNTQDNYFFGDSPNSFYGSSQRNGHNTEPWLRPVSLFQILFDEDTQEFEYNHLTSFLTAGKWNAEAPAHCDAPYTQCAYQWTASPLPYVDSTGRKLLFTSTMGKYSYTDHNLTGASPYGTSGLFLATLALNSEVIECVDNDKDGFGSHCVFGADCNDNNHFINPNVPEVYDGIDNDCDAQIDCADDSSLTCLPKNLYVDVDSLGGTCSDGKTRLTNSMNSPFCSVERATEVVEPGDTVLICQGTYNERSGITLNRGGTSVNHRVVFKPYQNESVNIFLGQKFNSWSDLGSGIYSKNFSSLNFDLASLKAITENSLALLEADSISHLQDNNYAQGQNLFYVNENTGTVYLRLTGVNTDNIFFVDQNSQIKVEAPFITWQNLNIAYGYKGFNVGFYGIWDNYGAHGKYFYLHDSTIKYTYYEGLYSNQQFLQVANNVFDYNGVPVLWDGDSLEKNYDAIGIFVKGADGVIEANTIKHVVTGIDYRSNSYAPGFAVKNFIIRNNDIYGRVVGSGFNNLFYNNIIQYLDNVGFSLYYDNQANKVYNNLIYSTYGVLLSRYDVGQGVDFRNNIVLGNSTSARCLDFDQGNLSSFTLNNNLYYNCSSFRRNNAQIASSFIAYKSYIAGFDQDQNALGVDPGLGAFDDAVAFYPNAQSAVVDAGLSLSGSFTFDKQLSSRPYNGVWDIGPYEFGAAVVAPTCTDNIQNGSETGIDCGGSCTACAVVNPPPGNNPPPPPEEEEEPEIACGNSIQEQGETCDDGNTNNNDGCSYLCQIETDVTPTSTPNQVDVPKLQGRVVKTADDPRVYYLNTNNDRYYIPNLNTYLSWMKNFNNLETITPQNLASYEYKGRLTVKPGNLVKFENNPKVYAVEPTKTLRWITTAQIFQDFGYDFNKVIHLPQEDFSYYNLGEDLNTSTTHPTGQLLKHGDYKPVFYIKDNIEYWIKDETTFLSLGFKWQDIITIPVRYWYTRVLDNLSFRLKDR